MVTKHSIRLEGDEPCFASIGNRMGKGCYVLSTDDGCGAHCPFYKPRGCESWVKTGNIVVPPEEYFIGGEE